MKFFVEISSSELEKYYPGKDLFQLGQEAAFPLIRDLLSKEKGLSLKGILFFSSDIRCEIEEPVGHENYEFSYLGQNLFSYLKKEDFEDPSDYTRMFNILRDFDLKVINLLNMTKQDLLKFRFFGKKLYQSLIISLKNKGVPVERYHIAQK